jgi:Spy/CpxP family protein refolding chaperone
MNQLDPTASDYDAKLAEVANTKAAMSRERTLAKGDIRKQMAQILTPEQQAKMKAFQKERRGGGFRRGFGKRHDKNQSE